MIQKDTEAYGFFGLTDEETTWMDDVKLEPPSLNVSAFYFEYFSDYYGNKWKDPRGNPHYPFCFPENTTYVIAGELYHLPYAKEHGKCQPASEVSYLVLHGRKARRSWRGRVPRVPHKER